MASKESVAETRVASAVQGLQAVAEGTVERIIIEVAANGECPVRIFNAGEKHPQVLLARIHPES